MTYPHWWKTPFVQVWTISLGFFSNAAKKYIRKCQAQDNGIYYSILIQKLWALKILEVFALVHCRDTIIVIPLDGLLHLFVFGLLPFCCAIKLHLVYLRALENLSLLHNVFLTSKYYHHWIPRNFFALIIFFTRRETLPFCVVTGSYILFCRTYS